MAIFSKYAKISIKDIIQYNKEMRRELGEKISKPTI